MRRVSPDARRPAWTALLAGAAVLTACGGQDVVVEPAPTPQERGVAPAAGGTVASDPLATRAAETPLLRLTVDDSAPGRFHYRAPRQVRGGLVEIRLRNSGDAPQKAQLWRITGNHTVKQALRARSPLPDWLRRAGGVALTEPGRTGRSLQSLPAGNYYVAATLGNPGSVARFKVIAPEPVPEAPRAPARIEAIDFSFKVSGLKAGRNTIDFDNTGGQPHHAFFAPLRSGADLDDVKRFFSRRTSTGRPPVDAERTRETVVLEGGDRQVTELDLAAGRYALICFVRGRRGGPQHIELGMINEVTVR